MKNYIAVFLISYFILESLSSNAQGSCDSIKKIDIKNLKKQTYLIHANKINCDSINGSIIEMKICANLELQKQDSLLQAELNGFIDTLRKLNHNVSIKKIKVAQDIWEKYRYQHCSCMLSKSPSSLDLIMFMQCATDLTISRRSDIMKLKNK